MLLQRELRVPPNGRWKAAIKAEKDKLSSSLSQLSQVGVRIDSRSCRSMRCVTGHARLSLQRRPGFRWIFSRAVRAGRRPTSLSSSSEGYGFYVYEKTVDSRHRRDELGRHARLCSPGPGGGELEDARLTGAGLSNTGSFNNLQASGYWLFDAIDADIAWRFDTLDGVQDETFKDIPFYAMAVRNGDVLAVLEPSTLHIAFAGLACLGVMLRRRHGARNDAVK